MNYSELCKAVTGLHGGIEVAIVLSGGKLAASHLKSGGPAPDEQEFGSMISQLDTIVRTTKANEDKFGELGFVMIHYRHVDGLLLPVNDSDTLIVGMMPPYDRDDLIGKISLLIAKKRR